MTARPRVALVHDYLTQRGGAERVVLELARAFPGAPLYTSMYAPELTYPDFRALDVRPTPLDRVHFFRTHHRAAFPALALTFSTLCVDADVVVCSSSGWAHAVRTEGAKVVYCHAVARWLTQPDRYIGASRGMRRASIRGVLATTSPLLRRWDARAAASATQYLANSDTTRRAVMARYGIEATVLRPPTPRFTATATAVPGLAPGFVLCVNRLLPYKNVDVVLRSFSHMPDVRLVVVGDGPEATSLAAAASPNVTFLRRLDDGELRWCYEHCAALVAASYEDFGLTVLEAAAAGRPGVVLRAGGYVETVVEGTTGLFFDSPEPSAIAASVRQALARAWDDTAIRAHAATFSADRFVDRMRAVVAALGPA
jgi:glycosyltransferase involved in cell wall biosynthesis